MSTPYRDETEALRERKAALEAESNRLKEQRAQLDWLTTREGELQKELAAIDEKLGGRRKLPMLDQVSVASPCNASWDEMLGDERVRFCVSCEKNVFNISALPKAEAEAFIAERAAGSGEVCIRFYQRADGTIMTSDCPVGATKKRRKKLALAVAGAGAMAFGAYSALHRAADNMVMGKMEPVYTAAPPPTVEYAPPPPPVTTEKPNVRDVPDNGRHVAGRMRIVPPSEQATPVIPKRPTR